MSDNGRRKRGETSTQSSQIRINKNQKRYGNNRDSNKVRGVGSPRIGNPARQQGLYAPSESERPRTIEPRGKRLDNGTGQSQHLFPKRNPIAGLAV